MLQRRLVLTMQIALLLALVSLPARADWVAIAGGVSGEAPRVMVTVLDAATTEVTVTIPGLDLARRTVDGSTYDVVTIPTCAPRLTAGEPELPLLARALRLPDAGTPELTIVSAEWSRLDGILPIPSRGPLSRAVDPATVPLTRGAAYAADAIWPADVASLGRPFLVRNQRGVALRLNPVRWHAGRGQMEALVSLTLQVAVRGSGGVNTVVAPTGAAHRTFDPLYRSLFAGQDPLAASKAAGDDPEGHGYGASERMLVITAAPLRASVAEFAQWKRECGYTVDVVDMDELGGNAMGMRTAVQDRFFSDAGLAHLVLVGDVQQVPTNIGGYQGADSDGMFGLLAGDDLYVDVLVSRLPARNSDEARVMLGRTIAYERDPQNDAAWYAAAVGIASDEGDPADYERCELLRDDLLAGDYADVARIYQGFGGARNDISSAVNGGASLVNYLGHGSGSSWMSVPFAISDVHQLTNTTAWPWIIDVSCSNGDFSREECFAEAWLRANDGGQPTGAVAMISASTATSWVPPCVMQEAMVDGLIAGENVELGALYAVGIAAVLVQYEGTTQAIKLMEQYNLFGDGSLQVRSRAPELLAVSHASYVPVGTAALSVTLPAGARVVLSDGEQILARGTAGDTEQVQLVPARPLNDGELVQLTVTAHNGRPYRVELPVAEAPTAALDSLPDVASLLGNWPNPFNPQTTVGFSLPQDGPVRLSIHDARGRLVRVLMDGSIEAGNHRVTWDGRDQGGRGAASGVYLARLETAHGRDVRKLTLAR